MIKFKVPPKTLLLFFLGIFLSCQCDCDRRKEDSNNTTNEEKNELRILFYTSSLDYSLSLEGNIVKVIDQHLEATVIKELYIHNDTVAKIKSMASEIIYISPPKATHLSRDTEIKMFLDGKLIHHDYSFGRDGNEKVDALIDYLLKLLDYKIYIFSFPLKNDDGTYEWKY